MAQKNLERRRALVENKQRPSPPATRRRPAKRGAGHDLDGFVVIGRELRGIANRLKLAESCLTVIHMALDRQDVERDCEIARVLMHVLNRQIFRPIRDLENVAATCDGGPRSDRNEDNKDDDDTEDAV